MFVSDLLSSIVNRIHDVEPRRNEIIQNSGKKKAYNEHLSVSINMGRQSGHSIAAVTLWMYFESLRVGNSFILTGGKQSEINELLRKYVQIEEGELEYPVLGARPYDWRQAMEGAMIKPGGDKVTRQYMYNSTYSSAGSMDFDKRLRTLQQCYVIVDMATFVGKEKRKQILDLNPMFVVYLQ